MIQGDSYYLPFQITSGGEVVDSSSVKQVEITIGQYRKTYPNGGLVYDSDSKTFDFLISQQQTLSMYGNIPVQIRCLTTDGMVIGTSLSPILIEKGISQEVLSGS